jgi:hypothetical protein
MRIKIDKNYVMGHYPQHFVDQSDCRVVDPDPDPDWIRIQSGLWIGSVDPDPGGQK